MNIHFQLAKYLNMLYPESFQTSDASSFVAVINYGNDIINANEPSYELWTLWLFET